MTKQWWEIGTTGHQDSAPMVRAVAYYRHSAQDRQENSIPIQQDQVREAARFGWLNSENRPKSEPSSITSTKYSMSKHFVSVF